MQTKENSRTKKAYLNAFVTLISNILQIIMGFVIRKLFINYLGIEYLGYNSVFQNVLQMLNLADLGIGIAITSFLYKPLAVNDKRAIASLMYMYKKIYGFLGIIVLAIGLFFSLILQFIVTDATCSVGYLRVLFLINLVGTVSTYYLAYKRILLIADQKSYVTSMIDTIAYFAMTVLQAVILIFFPNYILYLIITVGKNIVANIVVSIQCGRIYGNYSKEADKVVIDEYKPQIIRYVKDVFVSKLGAYVYYSTDNIIISIFRGSMLTGYLSNYTLVTGQINTIVSQVLSAIQATLGNYVSINDDVNAQKRMTDNYLCINFCIGNFCMLCLMFLIQPFVELIFGTKFVLEFSTAILLSVNLMLKILIQVPSQVFMIYKIYHFDRPIVVISAITNIVVSSVLVGRMGINGVLIGTYITSLFYLFSRFYVISKKVYGVKYVAYILTIAKYLVISCISVLAEFFVVRNVKGTTFISFGVRMLLVGLVALVVPAICLSPTKEFQFFLGKIVPKKLKTTLTTKRILVVCIIVTLICGISGSRIHFSSTSSASEGNKSLSRTDVYEEENILLTHEKIFHLSFDDTIELFEDLTENESADSIFDNETLSWFKELHDKYGVIITCFVYFETDKFSLDQCTEQFKAEFEENSDWLRFGFHSLNEDTVYGSNEENIVDDYQKTISVLKKIVGETAIDNVIRLQMFQGSEDDIIALTSLNDEPIVGLLTADDLRNSYGLSKEESEYIYSHDELRKDSLTYYSTDLRAEYIENISAKIKDFDTDSWNNQTQDMVVFSHEWQINAEIKATIEKLCKWAVSEGYSFEFFEDIQ